MPRGRAGQDPYEAKDDSVQRILAALKSNPDGLRFKQLKTVTKLHQDTLTIRLRELVEDGVVIHSGKLYKISSTGEDDLSRRQFINQIDSTGGMVVVGGRDDSSLFRDEDVILKSTVGYAFPAISPGVVGSVRRVLHKYWMLHVMTNLASQHKIDPRCLTGEKPLEDMVDELRSSLTKGKLVLAFLIDQAELKERLNLEYVQEILRLAKVEDDNRIETKNSEFMKTYQRYVMGRSGTEQRTARERRKCVT